MVRVGRFGCPVSDLLIDRIQPKRDDGQQVVCALLFRRLLSAYQAVIILAERGMHTEGLVHRRGMLEALFALGAMWQQPATVQDYVGNDLHRRRDMYKNLLKASAKMRNMISASIIETELRRQSEELTRQTKGITYLSVEEFSNAPSCTICTSPSIHAILGSGARRRPSTG